ncbi:MAG: DpnI domain-containing protein [Aliarcobacter sp.]|jgi:type II restriction enzyme|nr:DpnI domain-containing protein [Aliarcobacter sp.]
MNIVKRAGWVGCNILLETIPQSGKIFYIKDSKIQSKNEIVDSWNKTIFLKDNKNLDSRGWLLDIIKCIEKMNKKDFLLNEIYQFENYLNSKHPNNNIQAKIRQQLDNNYKF